MQSRNLVESELREFALVYQSVDFINSLRPRERRSANHRFYDLFCEAATQHSDTLLQHIINRFSTVFYTSTVPTETRLNTKLTVNAEVAYSGDGKAIITHQLGSYLALTDLACRLAAHKDFISTEFGPNHGMHPHERGPFPVHPPKPWLCAPQLRYVNYAITDRPDGTMGGPIFYTAFPLRSERQVFVAGLLKEIAFAWIHRHEEHHVAQGHFDYLRRLQSGSNIRRGSELDPLHADTTISRALELDADFHATSDVLVEYLFDPTIVEALSSYYKYPRLVLFRLINVSISMVLFVFDKARQHQLIRLKKQSHPAPFTRFLNVLRAERDLMATLGDGDFSLAIKNILKDPELNSLTAGAFKGASEFNTGYNSVATELSVLVDVLSWEDGNGYEEDNKTYSHYFMDHGTAISALMKFPLILNTVMNRVHDLTHGTEFGLPVRDLTDIEEMFSDTENEGQRGKVLSDSYELMELMEAWWIRLRQEVGENSRMSPVYAHQVLRLMERLSEHAHSSRGGAPE